MGFGISDITEIFKRPKVTPPSAPSSFVEVNNSGQTVETVLAQGSGTYSVEPNNWYSAKPYGFRANTRGGRSMVMFLPISPSNLSIATPFATNIIPTLYGTIEEHSNIRYFDITIEGTTGMAPRFVNPSFASDPGAAYKETRKSGRSTVSIAGTISLGGFFAKTLGTINQAKNKAADLLDGGPKAKAGLIPENSGYVAFHNLYRFLLQYKADASGVGSTSNREKHPLTFFNYKDNNEYDVVVRNFILRRTAENPHLYYYSIQLRAYNLRSIGKTIDEDLKKRLEDLGLNGVDSSSVLGDIKSLSSGVKGVLGSLSGGLNVLGR